MFFKLKVTAFTSLLVIHAVLRIDPVAVAVIGGLVDRFGLSFAADGTSIGLRAFGHVRRRCCNDTCIPFVIFVSNLTASGAGVLVGFGIILFPIAESMFTYNGNCYGCDGIRNVVRNLIAVFPLEGQNGTGNRACLDGFLCLQGKLQNVQICPRCRIRKHRRCKRHAFFQNNLAKELRVIHDNPIHFGGGCIIAGNPFKCICVILELQTHNCNLGCILDIHGEHNVFANVCRRFRSSDRDRRYVRRCYGRRNDHKNDHHCR